MKTPQKNVASIFGSLLVMSVAGCAATPVPQDLLDARSSYQRAVSGPAMQYQRDQVYEAKVALDKAEQSYRDDAAEQNTKDLAHVARRKAELAEANGASAQVRNIQGQADNDAKETTTGQLAQARWRLASADTRLARRERQLEEETKESADADKMAKDAMDRLAATVGTVRHEFRGTVITLSGSVLFASNNDALLPGAQNSLGQVADALKTQGDREIVVEGHTDSQGSAASNRGLSDRRARSVTSFLISRGVPGDNIRTEGLGSTRPIADNGSADGRASNRRVEIIVTPVEAN
jgi:outer membrane protein OmpA-like peptidoglycan-associated protein